MSLIPSLSLWSSIKIPLSVCGGQNIEEVKSSVPYVNSCYGVKQENQPDPAQKMVKLKIPKPTKKGKENSIADFFTVCRGDHKKGSCQKKKSQSIRFVTVPDFTGADLDRNQHSEESYAWTKTHNPSVSEISCCDEFSQSSCVEGDPSECNFELTAEKNLSDIPSIKPWTLEELHELNRKYNILEERIKMATERKKLHKIKESVARDELKDSSTFRNCLPCDRPYNEPSVSEEELFYDCDAIRSESNFDSDQEYFKPNHSKKKNSRSYVNVAPNFYYEEKLEELHKLKLGIKR